MHNGAAVSQIKSPSSIGNILMKLEKDASRLVFEHYNKDES